MLYLPDRYLKIFSVGMTYSVYFLGCGIQDGGFRGSIREKGSSFFPSPKYPEFPLTRPVSLQVNEKNKCFSVDKTGGA